MKLHKLCIFIIAIVFSGNLFVGCDDTAPEMELCQQSEKNFESSYQIGVSLEDGYLNFSSQEAFNDLFQDIETQLSSTNGQLKKSSGNIIKIDGFISLADRMSNQGKLKSSDTSEEEVYREMLNELIPVEPLHYLLDTINRVKVGEDIYQISPFGTFIYSKKYEDEFNSLILTFPEKLFDYTSQIDSFTYIYDNIRLIDTYNHIKNQYFDENVIFASILDDESDSIPEESSLKSATTTNHKIDSKLTSKYGLVSKKVNGGSFRNNRTSNYFDSKTRVRVRLYDNNFGVYKGAGFTCKFQKKKKKTITVRKYGLFGPKREKTLYSYWSSTINPEMAIGMDYFQTS